MNEANHPELAKADRRLAQVQGAGDAILARYGVRTPEQLAQAVDAPGRYRAGGSYERPTAAKQGVPCMILGLMVTTGSITRQYIQRKR